MVKSGQVMQRAWELFRATYNFPAIPFRSIGRPFFASCLRMAWAEAKRASALAETPTDVLEHQAASFRSQIDDLRFAGWGTNVERERRILSAALATVASELAKRQPAFAIAA